MAFRPHPHLRDALAQSWKRNRLESPLVGLTTDLGVDLIESQLCGSKRVIVGRDLIEIEALDKQENRRRKRGFHLTLGVMH